MSWIVNTTTRSSQKEIMDDFSMSGKLLRDTLDKLGNINKWLGGNKVTLSGLKQLLKQHPNKEVYTIIDLGCGHGDMLRRIAHFGRKNDYNFQLIGIDANQDAIDYAIELSINYPEIQFKNLDIFSTKFKTLTYDIVLATLFMHHLSDKEISILLNNLTNNANLGLVINDLHRHKIAYFSFKILGLFTTNEMIVKDGLTSILRGFKRKEIMMLSSKLKFQLQWKWAFRWQWIVQR